VAKELAWKETKTLFGNTKDLKLFKDWFEYQIFTKAKVNPNHFYGSDVKPEKGATQITKAYGMYITDKGDSNQTQYKKVIAKFKEITKLGHYKTWGYADLKIGSSKSTYPYVVTIERRIGGDKEIVLSLWNGDKDDIGKPGTPLYVFKIGKTTKVIRDPSKKTTDTSGKINNKGKPWGPFVKPSNAPWTVIQETISLKMFEHLIGTGGGIPGVKTGEDGFGDQPPWHKQFLKDGFCNKVIEPKLWPHIHHPDNYQKKENDDGTLEPQVSGSKTEWLGHFKRQYAWIAANTKFPKGKFDIFNYEDFMKFISDIVLHGEWKVFGKITKKDAWNPADIWIVRKGDEFDTLKIALAGAPSILKLNEALKNAFKNNLVCGISLKQSHPTPGVRYEEVNLTLTTKQFTDPSTTPFVTFDSFGLDIPFDGTKFPAKGYTKKTNDIIFSTKAKAVMKPIGKLRIGSNSSKPGNITQDMHGIGHFKAAFGKMPRDMGWRLLQQEFSTVLTDKGIFGFPGYNGGIKDKTYIHGKSADPKSKIKLPKEKLKENKKYWEDRVTYITTLGGIVWNSVSSIGQNQINNLVTNLGYLEKNGDPRAKPPNNEITKETNASLQFVEMLYLYCVLWQTQHLTDPPTGPGNVHFSKSGQSKFDWIMSKFFYFSQKKGSAFGSNFGPFGKLY